MDDFINEDMRMQNYLAMKKIQTLMQDNDYNKKGTLNMDEFMTLLIKTVGHKEASETTERIFKEIDVDNSGDISLEELATWYFTKDQIRKKLQTKPATVAEPIAEGEEQSEEDIVVAFIEESAQATKKINQA